MTLCCSKPVINSGQGEDGVLVRFICQYQRHKMQVALFRKGSEITEHLITGDHEKFSTSIHFLAENNRLLYSCLSSSVNLPMIISSWYLVLHSIAITAAWYMA